MFNLRNKYRKTVESFFKKKDVIKNEEPIEKHWSEFRLARDYIKYRRSINKNSYIEQCFDIPEKRIQNLEDRLNKLEIRLALEKINKLK